MVINLGVWWLSLQSSGLCKLAYYYKYWDNYWVQLGFWCVVILSVVDGYYGHYLTKLVMNQLCNYRVDGDYSVEWD
jgi:hypothetical protein